MSKISLLSAISALWMIAIGLLAIYATSAFVFANVSGDTAMSPLLVKTFAPNSIILMTFGIITCLAAAKQLRKRAPFWILASISFGVAYFFIHLLSITLIFAPEIDIEPVADFAIETAWTQVVNGPIMIIAIFALPLLYNLTLRRAPS